MEKHKEIARAKKRRAKLLVYFERRPITITKFSTMHGISRSRMGQLLAKARADLHKPQT
jgi:hypothetical protein